MASVVYPYEEDIPVTQLRVDLKNPRLPEVPDSQLDAFKMMASAVPEDKLIALASHIVQYNGLNPAQRFIVMPDEEDRFVVLDGNRRLTAIRALENPEVVLDKLSELAGRQMKRLAEEYKANPIVDASCTVFEDRDHADPWVELIHWGESSGAGTVRWSGQQRARHQTRKSGKPYHLQVLDYVAEHGDLSTETIQKIKEGKYPVSSLQRILNTPYVRARLGIDFKDGRVLTHYPKLEVLKGLSKIVDDFGSGRRTVTDIKRLEHRQKYINSFSSDELPDPDAVSEEPRFLEDALEEKSAPNPKSDDKGQEGKNQEEGGKERPHSSARQKLIPTNFKLDIDTPRINDIYIELKRRMKVREVPNAVAVSLRVFLELSVDEYLNRHKIQTRAGDWEKLHKKVEMVAKHMEEKGVMTKTQLEPIRRAVSRDTDPNSIRTLHGYVHKRHFSPGPDDLKATWDTLQFFFKQLWPS